MAGKSTNSEVAVLQDWRGGVDKTLERIETKIDNLDRKFAARWVQTVVGAMIGAILLGFIGVVVAFFIPNVRLTGPTISNTSVNNPPAGSNTTPTASDNPSSGGTTVSVPLPQITK